MDKMLDCVFQHTVIAFFVEISGCFLTLRISLEDLLHSVVHSIDPQHVVQDPRKRSQNGNLKGHKMMQVISFTSLGV